MAAQILEGTFAEVQQKINSLQLKPDRRVRFVVEEETEEEAIRRRHGVRLFPRKDFSQVLTTEMINDLLDQAELEEYLDANSNA